MKMFNETNETTELTEYKNKFARQINNRLKEAFEHMDSIINSQEVRDKRRKIETELEEFRKMEVVNKAFVIAKLKAFKIDFTWLLSNAALAATSTLAEIYIGSIRDIIELIDRAITGLQGTLSDKIEKDDEIEMEPLHEEEPLENEDKLQQPFK